MRFRRRFDVCFNNLPNFQTNSVYVCFRFVETCFVRVRWRALFFYLYGIFFFRRVCRIFLLVADGHLWISDEIAFLGGTSFLICCF